MFNLISSNLQINKVMIMPGGGGGKPIKPSVAAPEKQEKPEKDPKRVAYENKYKKRYNR